MANSGKIEQTTKMMAEWLFWINKDLEHFSNDVECFMMHEMVRKIVPWNLKPYVIIKYLEKDGDKMHEKDKIIIICGKILDILNVEQKIEQLQKQKAKSTQW